MHMFISKKEEGRLHMFMPNNEVIFCRMNSLLIHSINTFYVTKKLKFIAFLSSTLINLNDFKNKEISNNGK